jgi:hypothetical protein
MGVLLVVGLVVATNLLVGSPFAPTKCGSQRPTKVMERRRRQANEPTLPSVMSFFTLCFVELAPSLSSRPPLRFVLVRIEMWKPLRKTRVGPNDSEIFAKKEPNQTRLVYMTF